MEASVSVPNSQTTDYDRRWLILAVLSIAQLMVVLDATVVNIGFGSLLLLGGRPAP